MATFRNDARVVGGALPEPDASATSRRAENAEEGAPRPRLSVVIPVYNEEGSLVALHERPDILVLAGKRNRTRFVILHDGIDRFVEERAPGGLRGLMASLRGNPPAVAYLSQVDGELTRPLRDWVASEYQPSSTFSYAGKPFWIRRDGLQQVAASRRG
jgi:hypothetical protein